MIGIAFLVGSLLFLAWAGTAFQRRFLLQDMTDSDAPVRALFAVVFSASCFLLELIILEVTDVISADTRLRAWRFALLSLSVIAAIVLPFFHAWWVAREKGFDQTKSVILAVMFLAAFQWCFWHYGALIPGVPPLAEGQHMVCVQQVIARLAVVGTVFLALLSGYGTINMPFTWLAAFIRPVTDSQVASVETQLAQSKHMLRDKAARITHLRDQEAAESLGGKKGGVFPSWLTSLVGGGGGGLAAQISALEIEQKTLKEVHRLMIMELAELKKERRRVVQSRTLWGRVRNALGYVFAAYCIYRLGSSLISSFTTSPGRADPVGFIAALLVTALSGGRVQVDRHAIGQYVALAFVGFVTANSLRNFLKDLLKFTSSIAGLMDPSVLTLLFTEVMVMYASASLLLIRQKLPDKHRDAITTAIGAPLEFSPFNRWFNGMFFVTALLSALVLYKTYQAKRDGDVFYHAVPAELSGAGLPGTGFSGFGEESPATTLRSGVASLAAGRGAAAWRMV
ncbi:unnamed protein product [Pedinophyceae sp. YPF-701]|nr:unnamed protein product [Pedinophyceae sp. YPF-701]